MNSKLVKSPNFSLFVAGLVTLLVGTYTDNGGFQLAGGMLCFISLVRWLASRGKQSS